MRHQAGPGPDPRADADAPPVSHGFEAVPAGANAEGVLPEAAAAGRVDGG